MILIAPLSSPCVVPPSGAGGCDGSDGSESPALPAVSQPAIETAIIIIAIIAAISFFIFPSLCIPGFYFFLLLYSFYEAATHPERCGFRAGGMPGRPASPAAKDPWNKPAACLWYTCGQCRERRCRVVDKNT